jgi:predicted ribosomally synthesized peptide with nif11-like leader
MSVETALDFYKKLATDNAFRTRLEKLKPEERLKEIRNAGFTFSRADFDQATRKILDAKGKKKGELDDEQLEKVAGGVASGVTGLTDMAIAAYGISFLPPAGKGLPPGSSPGIW